MEIAPSADLYARPQHPYTRALLSAIPSPDPDARRDRQILKGDIPSPANPPSGCVFRTRCPSALDACAATVPQLREVAPGQYKACIRDDLD
jgi:peptide/nickel transport system ATP-binding protein